MTDTTPAEAAISEKEIDRLRSEHSPVKKVVRWTTTGEVIERRTYCTCELNGQKALLPCVALRLLEAIATAERRVAEAERELIVARACSNGKALDALQTLMEMTGSFNDQNPWLGVTAAVALLQLNGDAAVRRLAEAEAREGRLREVLREYLAEYDERHGGPPEPSWIGVDDRFYHKARAALDAAADGGGGR